ncbi:MAG: hypothetical protein KKG33_11765 [candidate division Zixibacteria bacterium]|nr:hypothetical protein [candidate division Zixibacteria bacterium]MBU1471098.1 hypothetical protein [candidate division Zixibacteria bacterium]MBU2626225.1 hypothetical protein [candidate division Zixibacteria bacterium]
MPRDHRRVYRSQIPERYSRQLPEGIHYERVVGDITMTAYWLKNTAGGMQKAPGL